MIIIFHFITKFLYSLFRNVTNNNDFFLTKDSAGPLAQRDAENELKFDPPVYKQRYQRATDILINSKWKNQISKAVDFGCAEFGLFVFLKNEVQVPELVFVDIDELLLQDNLYRIYPLNADYLTGREYPLTINVYTGSVADPDPVLSNTDAIVALEIIEHLYPDVLEALPYNFFSYIRPKIAIFTTPNADFNVLFQKLNKFRHEDHKFEWTREQFESWARNITTRFPNYTVCFDGVGLGPLGSEHLGSCSQLAVFIRKDIICDNYVEEFLPCVCSQSTCESCSCICLNCIPKSSYGICTYESHTQKLLSKCMVRSNDENCYKLIVNVEYPRKVDNRSEEEKILDELKYRIHLFENVNDHYYNAYTNRVEIPLNRLVQQSLMPLPTEAEVRTLLLQSNYKIEECFNAERNQFEACVICEPEMENSSSDTEASGYGSDSNKYTTDDAQLSDWDDKAWDNVKSEAGNETQVKNQLHLEVSNDRKQQGALFDSGYQKSPSVPDQSPQPLKEIPVEFKSLNIEKPNKLSNILSVFDNFDKINELDAIPRERKIFNFSTNLPHHEVMKKLCQEIAKHPIAGPSHEVRKTKPKKSPLSDSDDSADEAKSIVTCILENSLNKIEERVLQRPDFIHELEQQAVNEQINPQEAVVAVEVHQVEVENGDLANNNRDGEGNNYPPGNIDDIHDDNAVDNIELNNVNIDNNNEIIVEEAVQDQEEDIEENIEVDPPPDLEVAWSSREALFDSNSQIDLLEDFDMDGAVVVAGRVYPNNYVDAGSNSAASGPVLPAEDGSFPNWLLQIFEEGEFEVSEDNLHDEPHFYCQGDGLGVHPSVIAIDEEQDDDDGNESGSDSTSSSSGSVDFSNAENQSVQEVFAAPGTSENDDLVLVGQSVVHPSSSAPLPEPDEVFENAEESESNLVVKSTCSE